jgi:hypothetical protein
MDLLSDSTRCDPQLRHSKMPESITTLPPELILKVFRSVDEITTATRLSQTCRRVAR